MSLTALGFLGVYAILLLLAFVKHPIYGLSAYLWAFYNHPPDRWWGVDLPEVRWSLIAAVITLLATVRLPRESTRPRWHANGGARLLIAFTAWMWLQTLWAVHRGYHIEGCILFTKYVVLFYIIYRIVSDTSKLEIFSWGHILGCFILAWIAYTTDVSGRLDTVGGPGINDANILALQFVTGLVFAGFMFLANKSKWRWLAFATIPFILNGIILTASRSAFLAMLAAAATAVYFSPRNHRKLIVGALSLGLMLLLLLSHDLFWERMATLPETDETRRESSAQSRLTMAKYQWQMAKDFPLGVGHRGNEVLSPAYMPAEMLTTGNVRSAHNTFMAVLVDQGFPGAFILILLSIWVVRRLLQLRSLAKLFPTPQLAVFVAILATSLAACFVSGQFINNLKAEVQVWLIALLAALQALWLERIQTESLSNDSSYRKEQLAWENQPFP